MRFSNTEILCGIIRNISIEMTFNHILKQNATSTGNAQLVFVAFIKQLRNTIETGKYIACTDLSR